MFNKVAAVLFHLSPLVPFALGYRYTGIAMILLVFLAYVKTNKLSAALAELQKVPGTEKQQATTLWARNFWKRLTFLTED